MQEVIQSRTMVLLYYLSGTAAALATSLYGTYYVLKAGGVSSFEGGLGLATFYLFPWPFIVLMLAVLFACKPLRRRPRAFHGTVALFALLSVPLLIDIF